MDTGYGQLPLNISLFYTSMKKVCKLSMQFEFDVITKAADNLLMRII